ncbi:MAG: endolytic transglycosylase MltG [Spirochaetaceae bacterium]|nr:endolytic transglycosylase MltG [Spirochaetaceae bacterium]
MLQQIFRILSALFVFIGTLLLGSIATVALLLYSNMAPPSSAETESEIAFDVYAGESARSVGRRLEGAGIIRTRYFWYILCQFDRNFIKAGSYRIPLPINQIDLHSLLIRGQQTLSKVTVPEGSTIKKTARIMAEAGICSEQDFLKAASDPEMLAKYAIPGSTMEGYLYPDTYLFPLSFSAVRVVDTMAETFFIRLDNFPQAQSLTAEELYQKVTIASIVEREYRDPQEAALMAGVFYNRLDTGMALQSCATVEYVITEILGRPHPERLFDRDTEITDPYNTYTTKGLPPGPIASPGAIALNAAFNPAENNYLYFRLVEPASGQHYFSRTFDEHIQAGILYVK